jgi:N-acetylglucosamine kinase-like BadF-type ATPase
MEILLGVEGSGSKTQALVTDISGTVLGRGLGGSSNHNVVGSENAFRALVAAVEGALRPILPFGKGSLWSQPDISAACFGLAGVDTSEDETIVLGWLRQQGLKCKVSVLNDADLILAAGNPEGWGVALISGTGSICLGRSRDGRRERVGGWGHVFGDEGGGYQIAVDVLRQSAQAADGRGEAHELLKAVLHYWHLSEPAQLLARVYGEHTTIQDVAEISSIALDLSSRGDPGATSVVDRAAIGLAAHVDTIVRKLKLENPPLALGGGTLRAVLRKRIMDKLTVAIGSVAVVADPAQGAVAVARRLLGHP